MRLYFLLRNSTVNFVLQSLIRVPGPEVIKLFFMLNSTKHEISTAYKN